ncbi:branched-chain amino acid ABC transporter permease [Aminiphilus circumscriptus]|jgi:branched-chain amino acid transport system permease protein|uniref:branched-chain amino acid ABC transporter permease n=1 Tax=Aminiphilus circumscriptus TaxID=290732 RepID=UPI0004785A6E|nr:branched-chain amino acid ABC transporter permease [Aminiphilus circumscriptus]
MDTLRKYLPILGLAAFYLLVMALRKAGILTSYYVQILMFAMINCMVTLGLNLINGFTGQFSIGQAGFVAVGGYTSAAVTTLLLPSSVLVPALRPLVFLVSVLIGGIVAGIFGYLIGKPSLRLKGDYLAIVTLAFGEIIRSLIRLIPQVGGPRGFSGIPRYSNLLWIVLFFGATVWILRNYIYSAFGRACIACREDELAAGTMGVNTTKYKVMAFTIGSAIAGVAGGLLAHLLGYLHPDQFNYLKSIDFLVYLYAGGAGSMTGSIMGATLLTILPEMLRFLSGWRLVIYGIALVFLMLFRPQGIYGGKELPFLVPKIRRPEGYEGGQ